jgi:NAD(P)-dependent dehydrogenase (short-subunit alcohol dehydrogenase family)
MAHPLAGFRKLLALVEDAEQCRVQHGGVDKEQRAVAIVTAGTSEIGEATARTLAGQGWQVVVADVRDDKGRALAAVLGPVCSYVHAAAGSEQDMNRLVSGTIDRHGRIDALFNYASAPGPRLGIAELTPEAWDAMLAVLLRGVYLGLHFAAGWMRRQGSGSIVSTATTAGLHAGAGSHVAAAANAAVMQLTRSVGMELAGSGVRVNCICPLPHIDRAEVAAAAVWLSGEGARDINGHVLVIDGEPGTEARAPLQGWRR